MSLVGRPPTPLSVRFWAKVDQSSGASCWQWLGYNRPDGRGEFSVCKGKKTEKFLAHRLAYVLRRGPIPEDLCVCHRCDNPNCCNPEHLFLGTQLDNIHDCISKGRFAKGEKAGSSKLLEYEVVEIRALKGKISQRELAGRFGVKQQTISKIQKGKHWGHLLCK